MAWWYVTLESLWIHTDSSNIIKRDNWCRCMQWTFLPSCVVTMSVYTRIHFMNCGNWTSFPYPRYSLRKTAWISVHPRAPWPFNLGMNSLTHNPAYSNPPMLSLGRDQSLSQALLYERASPATESIPTGPHSFCECSCDHRLTSKGKPKRVPGSVLMNMKSTRLPYVNFGFL
jgi:hypothetical protein